MKTARTQEELIQLQLDLEAEMRGDGLDRFNRNNAREVDQGNASGTSWNRRIIKQKIEPLALAIKAYQDFYAGKRGRPAIALTYLKQIPPETAAFITLKVIFDSLPHNDLCALMIASRIGSRIQDQIRFSKLETGSKGYIGKVKESLRKANSNKYQHGKNVLVHSEKTLSLTRETEDGQFIEATAERWEAWPKDDIEKLGIRLIDIFAQNVLHKGEPIIQKAVRKVGHHKSTCYIEPTAGIVEWIAEFRNEVGILSPCVAPCVIPPKEWTTPTSGGFHTAPIASRVPMVGTRNHKHLKRLTRERMPIEYQCLNALQETKWQVNDNVLRVANEVLRRDLALGMPSKEPMEPRPVPLPADVRELKGDDLKIAVSTAQWDAFVEWKREAASIYSAEKKRQNNFVEAARSIAQANKYASFEAFYFVHSMDSRGRKYAQSNLISPQGGDLQKGLIRFTDGVELGDEGAYWLAVQGAGVWAKYYNNSEKKLDKLDFDARVQAIVDMTEDIRDYATAPLQFTGWCAASKPWQFLNFCFEWAAFQDHIDAGLPRETFKNHIPAAQDGTCSGIQHYSAMLRDATGGAAVNLIPSDAPRDIYEDVAVITRGKFKKAAKGKVYHETMAPMVQRRIAQAWLRVGITRDGTKKSVMTLPYGSTLSSCRTSIRDYLDTLSSDEVTNARTEGRAVKMVHPFTFKRDAEYNRKDAEGLCSKLVWDSIGDVVIAPKAGMKFIKQICTAAAKANISLVWETPNGFTVTQEIYESEARTIETQLMGRTKFTIVDETEEIDGTKMRSACAPNFVHSMDACHLGRVVARCRKEGIISFACIHDSFGVHAAHTPMLRRIILEEFVSMYEAHDVLAELKDTTESRILDEINVEQPPMGDLNLADVLKSKYAFG